MDWNFKAPSWDMSNVVDEEATLPNIETTVDDDDESNSRFGVYYRTKVDDEFSVDLKLGHVGKYHSGSDHIVPNKSKDFAASGVSKIASSSSSSPSSSGPYKRARATNNGTLTVSCLVDGCSSDLSTCRDYHRRHKVCEQHSKTPEVTIGGLKQRFCQQCSRFHSLEQFDEGKRSCRKRLDGHNRRRRKPQLEPVTRPVTFLSNYQGRQLPPFSSSTHPYFPSAMVMSPAWSGGLVNSSADTWLQNHNHSQQQDLFLGSSPASYNKEENKHQLAAFLNGDNNATPLIFNNNHQQNPLSESSDHHHMVMRPNNNNNNNTMFCDSSLVATTSSVHDVVPPPRALSLLSSSSSSPSQPHHTIQTVPHHTTQTVPHHRMCLMQPLGLSLLRDDDNSSNSFESVERVLVVPNNNNNIGSSDHHCCSSSSVYYDNHNLGNGGGGSHGSQANEAHHQLFPFQWE